LINDGTTPNDSILTAFFGSLFTPGGVVEFGAGSYKFTQRINLPDQTVLKGQGADSTTLIFDLGGNGHSIVIQGNRDSDSSVLLLPAAKGDRVLTLWDSTAVEAGDWIQLQQNDQDWVTSSWAELRTGQIVEIDSVQGRQVWLRSPLRMAYDTARVAAVRQLNPQQYSGVECLKIMRLDDTAPQQSSNILMKHAVNSWVKGIESENCTFAHVEVEFSANIYVAQSYFHHGFSYGGNGRAYGVVFQLAASACLVENNIFEHLRHSVLLQAGCNGNVVAYNYSFDPYWSSTPNNSAGDMVLHGNYAYANLFEQNICQNIVIDNSHGPNGPHNTFFRNRAELFGIFFSAANSPSQNLVANEVTNTTMPYSWVNYTIQVQDHLLHGNNDKGTIKPANTATVPERSYAYNQRPIFVPPSQWGNIGSPNTPNASSILAQDRWQNGTVFQGTCGSNPFTALKPVPAAAVWTICPNPAAHRLWIEGEQVIERVFVYNALGQLMLQEAGQGNTAKLQVGDWQTGWYVVVIKNKKGKLSRQKIIIQR
jgi:hypothetical protein